MTSSTPPTLFDLLREVANEHPEALALVLAEDPKRRLTYAELERASLAAAQGLYEQGLRPGDVLALWLPNGVEFVVLTFAAARLGLVLIPLNTRYGTEEVSHLLRQSQARAVVLAPFFLGRDYGRQLVEIMQAWRADDLTAEVDLVVTVAASPSEVAGLEQLPPRSIAYRDVLSAEPLPHDLPPLEDSSLANAFGTSGTTSFPKLALHTHRPTTRHAIRSAEAAGLTDEDTILGALPFCGTFGFVTLLAALAAGATTVIMPSFRPGPAVQAIREHRVTHLTGTAPILESILAEADADREALSSVTRGVVAASTVEPLLRSAEDEYGIRIVNVYGSSEVFAFAGMSDPTADVAGRAFAGGRVVEPDMRVRAVDPATGEVLGHGESGELQFVGSTVTPGYLDNPEATQAAFTVDGWYRTGDRGIAVSDTEFEYLSRLADTLRLSGFLVNPVEIEAFLADLDGVTEAAVVGIPFENDPDAERAVAFVVAGPDVTPQSVVEQCRGRLANYKIPSHVVMVDEFPTTPSPNGEKIQKNKLRDLALLEMSGRP